MAENSQPPLVVKVGGSLTETGRVKSVLPVIAASTRKCVIVPGGGAFADKVRNIQHASAMPDAAAHRLAMLGMHQMAELFIAIEPKLIEAQDAEEIHWALSAGRVPVWLPVVMMDKDPTIARDWSTTSDSLSVRLAEILGAPLLILKSVDVASGQSAEALSEDGVVDRAFPGHVARSGVDWRIVGPAGYGGLAALLEADH